MVTTDVHAPVEHVLEATSHIGEVRFGGGETTGGQIESALTRIKFHALRFDFHALRFDDCSQFRNGCIGAIALGNASGLIGAEASDHRAVVNALSSDIVEAARICRPHRIEVSYPRRRRAAAAHRDERGREKRSRFGEDAVAAERIGKWFEKRHDEIKGVEADRVEFGDAACKRPRPCARGMCFAGRSETENNNIGLRSDGAELDV